MTDTVMQAAHDWLVAATIATEVPPRPVTKELPDGSKVVFTLDMVEPAIRSVAEVIANRAEDHHFPDTAAAVVLQKKQFSAVCREDYWRRAVCGDWFPTHVQRCLTIWRNPALRKLVPGALYYYSPISMDPPMSEPSWLRGKTEVIVASIHPAFFRFYR